MAVFSELDVLKKEMFKNISEIEFKDFFAKASKCSDNNSRILLIVKPETYALIEQTPFLEKEYFEHLVELMKDKIHDNMEMVVRMPKSDKGDEGDLDSLTLGDELDLDDLDDLEGLEGFDDEDEISHLTFLLTRKIKVLLVVENRDDYLCIRRWAMSKIKHDIEQIKILTADKNGIEELFEKDYHKIIQKSMEQKKSVANLGIDPNSVEFKKFSDVMVSLKKSVSPQESEVNSFIDFMLMDEELFVKDGKFNLKAFTTIPSFISKNFGPLTQRIKEIVANKDEAFRGQIETINKTIDGLDDDNDISFFVLSEVVKDISFIIIKKLYLSNKVAEDYFNETLSEFDNIMSIISNPMDEKIVSLRLAIKGIITPYLNSGWKAVDLHT